MHILLVVSLLISPKLSVADEAARTCTTAQGLHELFGLVEDAGRAPYRLSPDQKARIVQLSSRFDRASMLWDFRSSALAAHSQTLARALAFATVTAHQVQIGATDFGISGTPEASRALSRAVDLLAALDCRDPFGPAVENPTRAIDPLPTSPPKSGIDLQLNANTRAILLGSLGFAFIIVGLLAIHLTLVRREAVRERYLCNIPAALLTRSKTSICRIHDISRGGAKLSFAEPTTLDVGANAVLKFARLETPIQLQWHNKSYYGVKFRKPLNRKDFAAALFNREAKAQRRDAQARGSPS